MAECTCSPTFQCQSASSLCPVSSRRKRNVKSTNLWVSCQTKAVVKKSLREKVGSYYLEAKSEMTKTELKRLWVHWVKTQKASEWRSASMKTCPFTLSEVFKRSLLAGWSMRTSRIYQMASASVVMIFPKKAQKKAEVQRMKMHRWTCCWELAVTVPLFRGCLLSNPLSRARRGRRMHVQ